MPVLDATKIESESATEATEAVGQPMHEPSAWKLYRCAAPGCGFVQALLTDHSRERSLTHCSGCNRWEHVVLVRPLTEEESEMQRELARQRNERRATARGPMTRKQFLHRVRESQIANDARGRWFE